MAPATSTATSAARADNAVLGVLRVDRNLGDLRRPRRQTLLVSHFDLLRVGRGRRPRRHRARDGCRLLSSTPRPSAALSLPCPSPTIAVSPDSKRVT
jgi:hypothetical protein